MAGVWSVTLRAALRAFGELGIDVDALCRACGIDRTLLDDVDARIPAEVAARMWPQGARLFGRPGLGLYAGTALPFGMLGALDYAFATGETIEDGLARVARYSDVVTAGATGMSLMRDGDLVRMHYRPLPLDDLRDYGIALIVSRLRSAGVTPLGVELRGPSVLPLDEYRRTFCGCSVLAGAAGSAVVIAASDAQRATPASLPGLSELVQRDLERSLTRARRDPDPIVDVRREVRRSLAAGTVPLAIVARRLGVGGRTLQRRLARAGTTLKELLDDERATLAAEHLRDGHLSIAEIAFLLGYSEPSAFSRAFLRATGERPAAVRARARGAVTPSVTAHRRLPSATRPGSPPGRAPCPRGARGPTGSPRRRG